MSRSKRFPAQMAKHFRTKQSVHSEAWISRNSNSNAISIMQSFVSDKANGATSQRKSRLRHCLHTRNLHKTFFGRRYWCQGLSDVMAGLKSYFRRSQNDKAKEDGAKKFMVSRQRFTIKVPIFFPFILSGRSPGHCYRVKICFGSFNEQRRRESSPPDIVRMMSQISSWPRLTITMRNKQKSIANPSPLRMEFFVDQKTIFAFVLVKTTFFQNGTKLLFSLRHCALALGTD